jgi:hypothetical protein
MYDNLLGQIHEYQKLDMTDLDRTPKLKLETPMLYHNFLIGKK